MMWFLVLSLGPMMFVTGFSVMNYEETIDKELVQRLRANAREVATIVADYEKYLQNRRNRHKSDPLLSHYLLTNSVNQARQHVQPLIRNSYLSSLSLFNRDGQLVATLTLDEGGEGKVKTLDGANIYLSDAYKAQLEKAGRMTIVDAGAKNSMDLIAITRIETKSGRLAGYVEEIISLGDNFLNALKKRLNLEVMLFDSNGSVLAGSHPDFLLYEKSAFSKAITSDPETFFELTMRSEPFRIITTQVAWGDTNFIIGLGASKQRVKSVLRTINYAFLTMLAAIAILMIFVSIVATRLIVRPVSDLVDAIQTMNVSDRPVEIPVRSDNEIGVLTESFNDMSRRIYQAKSDLEKKIKELENAYSELKETQARLVHSAKMASLGQLVAGIAHELNNPIGFIYSNMAHLRDYSQKLLKIIESAESSSEDISKIKKEVDFEYIVQDLPRLISSCEEGARRTRDIVLGLRNFSRLEEAKIKKVNLQEGIENTLRLIAGELKARINVHTDFKKTPEVLCYASQLNQVFMNILTNASQAIEGEGDIWISLRHIPEKGTGGKAQISIRDNGRGMPHDVADKIFDPFFTTKSVGQGTGLGLSISYGIVKKHGGDILVRSEAGKGTEFIVTVPVDGPQGSEIATA